MEILQLKFFREKGLNNFLFTTTTNNDEANYKPETLTATHTFIDLALHKNIMEVDNAYFNAYIKTIE